jgi:Zn-dependent oligopeptidase
METEESTEVSRDPGSLWGGREHQVGFGYSVDVTVILEGDVRYPYGGTDQEVAASIAKDFDDNWGENNACYAAVKEAGSELFGENEEVTHSTSGTASKVGDKTYRVTLTFTAKVSNSESAGDARQRHEDARGEAMGDRMRDEGR